MPHLQEEKDWNNIGIDDFILILSKAHFAHLQYKFPNHFRSEKHRGTFTERCEVCNRGFEDEEQQRKHSASHTQDERAGNR